ncbi:unnamed protein product [Brassica oleracea]|uniref:(rape) hypothetical protein n=1 Tax=Brassica napus TaxID=3708 RepID=A0A816I4B9_BRANA|nr:unnamed protein product [Brassica napus]
MRLVFKRLFSKFSFSCVCVCVCFFFSLQVISQVAYFEDERDAEDAIHWIDNIIPFGSKVVDRVVSIEYALGDDDEREDED